MFEAFHGLSDDRAQPADDLGLSLLRGAAGKEIAQEMGLPDIFAVFGEIDRSLIHGAIAEPVKEDQQALEDELAKLRDRITALEKEPDWPAGTFCIFRSGKCPAGFKGQQGRMAAIRMYHGGDTSYLKTMRFGNSSIGWHNSGAATRNGESWLGELNLSVCCKTK